MSKLAKHLYFLIFSLNSEASYRGKLSVCHLFRFTVLFSDSLGQYPVASSSSLSSFCLSPVCLPLISHSCTVVRHLSFALSSPAPSRCFILITPSAHPTSPIFLTPLLPPSSTRTLWPLLTQLLFCFFRLTCNIAV